MEIELNIYMKGYSPIKDEGDPRNNPHFKRVHFSIADENAEGLTHPNPEHIDKMLFEFLRNAIDDIQAGRHRYEDNRFGAFASYYWY